jgi:hypothetical protein
LEKLPPDSIEILPDQRQRIIAGPIDRMFKRGELEGREFSAAEQFRKTHYTAQIAGPASRSDHTTPSGSRRDIPAVFRSQFIADARLEWREVVKAFKKNSVVWAVLRAAAIDETPLEQIGHDIFRCIDRREARAAARAGIRTALGALADHYGL